MCNRVIEKEPYFGNSAFWPSDEHYYLVYYEPSLFGFMRKKRKLVAIMPFNGYNTTNTDLESVLHKVYINSNEGELVE